MSKQPRATVSTAQTPRSPARAVQSKSALSRQAAQRTQARRHAQEERYHRLTLLIGGAIVAVVLVILGVGWYESYISPFHKTVIKAGNRSVQMNYFIDRIRAILPQFELGSNSLGSIVSTVPNATRDTLEEELVLFQRASLLGVSASNQDIQAEMAKELGVTVDKDGQPTNRSAFESALRAHLQQTGLSMDEYRQQVEGQVLKTKVQQKLTANVPAQVPQLKYSVLAMNTRADAQKVLDQLNGGQDWTTVEASVKNAPTTGSANDYDFQPQEQADEKLATALLAIKPDQYTGIVQTADGKYAVAYLQARDDQHALTDTQRAALTPKLYKDWVDQQKQSLKVQDYLTEQDKLFAVQHSGFNPSASQAPPQHQPVIPPGLSTPAAGTNPQAVPANPPAPAPAAAPTTP